jgi:nitrogen regulatory protein PII
MSGWRLLTSIVPRGGGETVAAAANRAGADGGTVFLGAGTAPNAILQFLGLGESAKEIVLNVVPEGVAGAVLEAVAGAAGEVRARGIAFATPIVAFVRSGDSAKPQWSPNMNESAESTAVVAIVNRDYADDALAAARKAGAAGGTVLQARGTAKEGDAAFFGVKLVPEKDVLVILAPKEKAEGILEAIRSAPCFAEKGSGIVFAVEASGFTALGGGK